MLRIAAALAFAAALGACTPPATEAPTETVPAETAAVTISVTNPTPGARISSPLRVEGTAPGDWFFEAVFPAELRSADESLIAESPAQAQSDWMTEAPVPFVAELHFTVTQETPATLVLQEDMPGDAQAPREIRVPVVLVPAN
jgi:hypothetical protein